MKHRHLLILFLFLVVCVNICAQSFTLKGRVTDEQMRPIEMATVAVLSQGKVTLTSLKGEFRFSMIGYKARTRVLYRPQGKQTLQIVLRENDNTLEEVSITEMRRQTGQTQELKKDATKLSPSTTGNGVEELIQAQVGVSTHNELSSQYNVRGGAFDENSVYINNVEVYRPFLVRSGQQEGLSVINPDMVEKIGFSTGGYAAKYGWKQAWQRVCLAQVLMWGSGRNLSHGVMPCATKRRNICWGRLIQRVNIGLLFLITKPI